MALTSVTNTTLDPGLGFITTDRRPMLFLGCCSAGTVNTLVSVGRGDTSLGQGPLAEAVAYANQIAGGPQLAMRCTGSVAATTSSVTQSGGGPTVSISGTALDRYDGKILVTLGGALGAGKFKYTLDGGRTYSPELTIPSGGSYVIANTGLTATFPSGTYVLDETYTWTTTEPYINATNLSAAVTALLATENRDWRSIVIVGAPADASAGATLFAALDTHMTSLANSYHYNRAIMDAGIDSAGDWLTGYAATTSRRISVVAGSARYPSGKPFVGFALPMQSASIVVGARAAVALISESLGRRKSGPLRGVTGISYNAYTDSNGSTVDAAGFTTLRNVPGLQGYHVEKSRIMAPVGSDFDRWELGQIMDEVDRTVTEIMLAEINENFATQTRTVGDSVVNGTIAEAPAADLETKLNSALRSRLLDPTDAAGNRGHVSDVLATIDRTNNFLSTRTLNVTTRVRPKGTAETITTTSGFTSGSVDGEAPDESTDTGDTE